MARFRTLVHGDLVPDSPVHSVIRACLEAEHATQIRPGAVFPPVPYDSAFLLTHPIEGPYDMLLYVGEAWFLPSDEDWYEKEPVRHSYTWRENGPIPFGYWADDWRVVPRADIKNHRFFSDVQDRDQLIRLVSVWLDAFQHVPDVELHIRTTEEVLNGELEPPDPRITLFVDVPSNGGLLEQFASAHTYVAVNPIGADDVALKAAASGMPVIVPKCPSVAYWSVAGPDVYATDLDLKKELRLAYQGGYMVMRKKGDMLARMLPPVMDWSVLFRRIVSEQYQESPILTP